MCVFFLLSIGLLQAEFRTFTNDFGDSVEAELIELKEDGSIVRMRLKNGRKINAAVSAFSQSDKKYIREWWKEKAASQQILSSGSRVSIEVKIKSRTRNEGNSSLYSDQDDVIRSFYPEIIIDNIESQNFKGNEVRLVIFADDMRYKDQILVVSAKNIKTDFKERSETKLNSDSFRLRHYEYDSHYSSYEYENGYKYTGYAIMVKNSKGEVTHQYATKERYLDKELFYKCKSGEMYDRKFEHKMNASPNSYYVK